jgi:hypothetical protein
MLTDSKKSLANETAVWQYALNEALTANDDSTYRNDEKLDLLATIFFEQIVISVDPSKGDDELDPNDPTPLVDHPLVDEATRFEKLAAEYGDSSKWQTYYANLHDWDKATHDELIPGLEIGSLQVPSRATYAKSVAAAHVRRVARAAQTQPLLTGTGAGPATLPPQRPWNIQDLHGFSKR